MDLLVLNGELVVVCDLLAKSDWLLRVDDNLLFAVNRDDLGIAVRLKYLKKSSMKN
jgi:hypothetical protein